MIVPKDYMIFLSNLSAPKRKENIFKRKSYAISSRQWELNEEGKLTREEIERRKERLEIKNNSR